MIPAIETRYNGYRFRSRLEARWAIFFDSLGFKYEYEFEGFHLPSGRGYLPDFLLPDFKVFVEVKPNRSIPLADLKKVVEFALEGDFNLLLIIGTPAKEEMFILGRRSCPPVEEYEGESSRAEEVVADFLRDLDNDRVCFAHSPFPPGWHLVYHSESPWCHIHLQRATLEAKQARFEFGETPK